MGFFPAGEKHIILKRKCLQIWILSVCNSLPNYLDGTMNNLPGYTPSLKIWTVSFYIHLRILEDFDIAFSLFCCWGQCFLWGLPSCMGSPGCIINYLLRLFSWKIEKKAFQGFFFSLNRWEDRKRNLIISFVSPRISFWDSSESATQWKNIYVHIHLNEAWKFCNNKGKTVAFYNLSCSSVNVKTYLPLKNVKA